MAELTENQEPEKVESKKKKSGEKQGMSLTTVIILVLSVVVVQAVLFILIYKFVLKTPENAEDPKNKSKTEKHAKDDPMASGKMSEIDEQEQEFIAGDEHRDYVETDRITTNPLNSSKFVAIRVYLEFRVHPSLFEILTPEDQAEEKLKKDGPYMAKILANTRAIVIEQVGKMTEPEILGNKETLRVNIEKALKELFQKKKIFLREVKFTEFIMQ
jgi:flagellar basal body-associated protein FliL